MDELISVMEEIRDLLNDIDSKLDDIRGNGLSSISDVCDKLDDIRGSGLYSIEDVCSKLDNVETAIEGLE